MTIKEFDAHMFPLLPQRFNYKNIMDDLVGVQPISRSNSHVYSLKYTIVNSSPDDIFWQKLTIKPSVQSFNDITGYKIPGKAWEISWDDYTIYIKLLIETVTKNRPNATDKAFSENNQNMIIAKEKYPNSKIFVYDDISDLSGSRGFVVLNLFENEGWKPVQWHIIAKS